MELWFLPWKIGSSKFWYSSKKDLYSYMHVCMYRWISKRWYYPEQIWVYVFLQCCEKIGVWTIIIYYNNYVVGDMYTMFEDNLHVFSYFLRTHYMQNRRHRGVVFLFFLTFGRRVSYSGMIYFSTWSMCSNRNCPNSEIKFTCLTKWQNLCTYIFR